MLGHLKAPLSSPPVGAKIRLQGSTSKAIWSASARNLARQNPPLTMSVLKATHVLSAMTLSLMRRFLDTVSHHSANHKIAKLGSRP